MADAPAMAANDRLGMTLFLATALHGIAILGLGFGASVAQPRHSPSVEVVMLQTASKEAPEDTTRIAQASQRSSGTSARENRPSSPLTGPKPTPSHGRAPVVQQAVSPARRKTADRAIVAQEQAERKVRAARERSSEEVNAARETHPRPQRKLELAQLVAELAERQNRYAKRPRVNYIDTLSAKSALEAGYLQGWIQRVERVGNLNYPDQARRQQLSGSLILHVLLDSTGHVIEVKVGRPSGEQVLDDAARRIVELAAPYEPFPAAMRAQYDRLMITRTWVFRGEDGLHTQ